MVATLTACAALLVFASPSAASVSSERIVSHRFTNPVQIVQPPDDSRRLMIVTQRGRVRVIKDGRLLERPFLDLRDKIAFGGGYEERGLLSIAFPPDYEATRRFYVFYTNKDSDIRVKELLRSAATHDRADASSQRALLELRHPSRKRRNHYGGQLVVDPAGYLYISTGDAGGDDPKNRAQRLDSLFGKLLRIDPTPSSAGSYTNPPDNPFAGTPGAKGEIWALGLRNPWRFSIDGQRLLLPDVGEDRFEELNSFATIDDAKGANLGWSGYEGPRLFIASRAPAEHRSPAFVYCHEFVEDPTCAAGFTGCAIGGGQVAHDAALPELEGRYVYGDYCTGKLRSLDPADPVGTDAPIDPIVSPYSLTSIGTDNAGRIYMTSLTGSIWRLIPGSPEP